MYIYIGELKLNIIFFREKHYRHKLAKGKKKTWKRKKIPRKHEEIRQDKEKKREKKPFIYAKKLKCSMNVDIRQNSNMNKPNCTWRIRSKLFP